MGVENNIFWSEIVSGFGELGGTPAPRIASSTRPPPPHALSLILEGFDSQNGVSLSLKAITLPYVNISVVSHNEIQVKMISSWFDFQLTLINLFKPGCT